VVIVTKACKVLIDKSEVKTPFGKPKNKWEMLLKEITKGCGLDSPGSRQ
jgi:hypothetical protein